MVEIWKDIVNYEGFYQVSNMGRVKSFNYMNTGKEKIIIGFNGRGYKRIVLFKNGKHKHMQIHRLVGIAFIPNPDNKPCINHIDGNKSNNRADNLEWCTPKENIEHAVKNGKFKTGENHQTSKLTEKQILEIRSLYATGYYSHRNLANLYNVDHSQIRNIIIRKHWKNI